MKILKGWRGQNHIYWGSLVKCMSDNWLTGPSVVIICSLYFKTGPDTVWSPSYTPICKYTQLCHVSCTGAFVVCHHVGCIRVTHRNKHTLAHRQPREAYNNRQVWYESEEGFAKLIHSASSTYPPVSSMFTHSGCCSSYSGFSISTSVCLSHSPHVWLPPSHVCLPLPPPFSIINSGPNVAK